jgi:O-methyltransferase domain
MNESAQLRRLLAGYQVTEAIQVAVTLRLPDLLADGPRHVDDLADASNSHAATLYRLMRALAAAGVFEELPDRRFASNALSELLRADVENSLRPWVENVNQPDHRQAWAGLLDSVVTGRNAYSTVHGTDVWTFRNQHPAQGAIFDAAMTALSRQVAGAVTSAYDFSRFATVVDVGGGRGALLASVLAANPGLRGVLFDQPNVVAGAAPVLAEAGVTERCEVVSGDFFREVPTGGDAYLLKAIIHDWDDERSASILATVRDAMGPAGVLLLVERVLEGPNQGLDGKLSDLNMLVAPGGLERTEPEFDALLAVAGLRRTRTYATGSIVSVLEAERR